MALKECNDATRLIHHSDRGVQYCYNDYVTILSSEKIQISRSENGELLENAVAERVNGVLKDALLEERYEGFEIAQKGVAKAISVNNSLRPHSSCDMLTPKQAHQKTGALKKHWKTYYKKKEVTTAGPY